MNPLRIAAFFPLALAACTANVDAVSAEKSARTEATGWRTFRMDVAQLPGGLTVRGWDDTGAEARASLVGLLPDGDGSRLDDARLTFVSRGDALELRLAGVPGDEELFFFDWVEAQLPRAAAVELSVSSGDVRVLDVTGHVSIDSSSGDMEVRTAGTVALDSSSGDIRATARGGWIDSSSGDVSLTLAGERLADTEIDSSSGDVTVRVPDGAGFDVEIDANDDVEIRVGGTVIHSGESFHGRINGGGPLLRIDASSGDVRILGR